MKTRNMKKIIGLLGVGAIGLLVMSSTCSSDSQTGSAKHEVVAVESNISVKATGGIDFQKINLEKAKKEAAEQGKLIFIDAYTNWCGPCKQMAATTFMDEEVGKFFNENFINIKIEMEKDADGPATARQYNVRAYPTLLIIDDEGNLVKQTIGFQTKDRLMNFAESALN